MKKKSINLTMLAIFFLINGKVLSQQDIYEEKKIEISSKFKYNTVGKKNIISLSKPKLLEINKIVKTYKRSIKKTSEVSIVSDSIKILIENKLSKKKNIENNRKNKPENDDREPIPQNANFNLGGCQSTPPDNTIAISKNGFIIAADNCQIGFYKDDGTIIDTFTYPDFFSVLGDPNLPTSDPKVIYDNENNKFIFLIQSGDTPQTSKIIIAFSKDEDPSKDWIIYTTSAYTANNRWFDYPSLAVNNTEFFITGNLFNPDGPDADTIDDFAGNVLFQMSKDPCYRGDEIIPGIMWTDIEPSGESLPAICLYAVPSGTQFHYGPGVYLVNTTFQGGNKVFLYELTDNIDGNPEIRKYDIDIDDYEMPVPTFQKNTNETLDAGDCRIRSGYHSYGRISFVFTKTDRNQVYNGISFTRIRLSDLEVKSKFFHNNEGFTDYCYPAIAHCAKRRQNFKTVLIYLSSGSEKFPAIRVQYNKGRTMSRIGHSTRLIRGQNFYDFRAQNKPNRWGDYIGIQRRFGTKTAWAVGHIADNNNDWITRLIRIDLP